MNKISIFNWTYVNNTSTKGTCAPLKLNLHIIQRKHAHWFSEWGKLLRLEMYYSKKPARSTNIKTRLHEQRRLYASGTYILLFAWLLFCVSMQNLWNLVKCITSSDY
jgi:hypothetical protein